MHIHDFWSKNRVHSLSGSKMETRHQIQIDWIWQPQQQKSRQWPDQTLSLYMHFDSALRQERMLCDYAKWYGCIAKLSLSCDSCHSDYQHSHTHTIWVQKFMLILIYLWIKETTAPTERTLAKSAQWRELRISIRYRENSPLKCTVRRKISPLNGEIFLFL